MNEQRPGNDPLDGTIVDTPAPTEPPQYHQPPAQVDAGPVRPLGGVVDGGFFVAGALLSLWLAGLMIWRLVADPSWDVIVVLLGFWLLLAYVGLPRLEEFLAHLFVPDYFIGRSLTSVGILGDPINLAADGEAGQIHAAMQRAGWTLADEVTLRSSWRIAVSALAKRPYPAAPVSPLFLFGRPQAFSYQLEAGGSAAHRHHVRFWPVPQGWLLPGGYRTDWLADAAYDRKVGLSAFTLQITHKIDADIDVERNFVVDSVRYASPGVGLREIVHFSTAYQSRNGGGDIVRSDGTLKILDVSGEPSVTPARPTHDPLHRRLPPPPLLAVGALSALQLILAVVVAIVGVARPELELIARSVGGVVPLIASAVATFVLGVLTLLRQGWARWLLMAIAMLAAIFHLLVLSTLGGGFVVWLAVGLSVLIVIAATSSAARLWVSGAVPHRPGG